MGEEFHLPSKIFGFPVMMNRKWIIFKKNFLKNYLIFLYFVVVLKWVRKLSLSFLYLVSHEIKLFLRKFYQETSLSHVKLNKESFHWLFLFLKVIDPFFFLVIPNIEKCENLYFLLKRMECNVLIKCEKLVHQF